VWTADPSADGRRSAADFWIELPSAGAYRLAAPGAIPRKVLGISSVSRSYLAAAVRPLAASSAAACWLFVVQSDRPKLDDLRGNLSIGMTLQSARNIAKLGSKLLYAPVSPCRVSRLFVFTLLLPATGK